MNKSTAFNRNVISRWQASINWNRSYEDNRNGEAVTLAL